VNLELQRRDRAAVTTMATVVLSVALCLASRTARADQTIRGQVLFGGLPVPGAEVHATRHDTLGVTPSTALPATTVETTAVISTSRTDISTISHEDGTFLLDALVDGTWTLRVEMRGFIPVERQVTVPTGDAPLGIELTLLPFASIARPAADANDAARAQPPEEMSHPSLRGPDSQTPTGSPSAGQAGSTPSADFRPATAASIAPESAATASDTSDSDETSGAFGFGSADGLLINGSVNNGAASPFAQLPSFGNNRRGRRPIYNGGLGVLFGTSAWDAQPFGLAERGAAKPSYDDLQFLGTFSGPVRIPGVLRNGPTVFLGYQRAADHNISTQTGRVPSALERIGDFSQSRDAFGQPMTIVDPGTGLPFSGNVIPASLISPQATSLLRYYPQPNIDDRASFNFARAVPTVTGQDSVQLRATHAASPRHQLFGQLLYQRTLVETGQLLGFDDASRASSLDAAVSWSQRLSPAVSLRLRYQIVRTTNEVTPFFANRIDVAGNAGIQGGSTDPRDWGAPALVFTTGVASLGTSQAADNHATRHGASAEVVRSEGRHTVTVGGGLTRQRSQMYSQQDARGTFTFTGDVAGSDVADFLLGRPHATELAVGNADKDLRGNEYEAHVNDDWRVSPTLTVNAGVRWEYESPRVEGSSRLSNLDVASDFSAAGQVTSIDRRGLVTGRDFPPALLVGDYRGIQPRVGLAWRPLAGSSLVLRAGYGAYRNTAVYPSLALLLAQQPPFSTTFTAESTAERTLTLADGLVAPAALVNTVAIDPEMRVGTNHTWQASVQRDLPASLTLVGTYTGSVGRHLPQAFLPNTEPGGAASPCPTCPAGFVYLSSSGRSHRHAAQAQVRRRLRQGFAASATYTLATARDDAATLGTSGLVGASIAQDWTRLEAEDSPSLFDQRHLLSAQLQYTTGVDVSGGALLTGLKGALVKGWTVTTQITAGTGFPVTPVYLTSVAGTGIVGTIRPDVDDAAAEAIPPGLYANPAAYTPPQPGRWGSAERYSIRGPSQLQVNAGIGRTFLWGDRLTFDWRIDATNVLNHATFAAVDSRLGSPQFGLPTKANPMRRLQSSLRARF
jgi:hypothetical protein